MFFSQNVFFVLPYKESIFDENTCLFFLFWITHRDFLVEGVLNLFFINGKLHVLILSDFLPKRVILFSFLTEMKCFDFSWNASPCIVWILPFSFSFLQSNFSHQIKVLKCFPGWSGFKGRGYFCRLSFWDMSACIIFTFSTVS